MNRIGFDNFVFFISIFLPFAQFNLIFFLILSTQGSETEHWRKQYEELFAKVKPFQVSHFHHRVKYVTSI